MTSTMPKTKCRTSPSEVEKCGTIENHIDPPHLDWKSSGIIPPDYWFSRDSVYAGWMTDGSLRRAILERINTGTFSATSFFTKQLLFNPPLPVTFKGRLNYGSDHLPLGYVQWLQSRGLSVPPLGGSGPVGYHQATRAVTKMVMGVNGLLVPQLTSEVFSSNHQRQPSAHGAGNDGYISWNWWRGEVSS